MKVFKVVVISVFEILIYALAALYIVSLLTGNFVMPSVYFKSSISLLLMWPIVRNNIEKIYGSRKTEKSY